MTGLVESRAEITLVPNEPSEFEKLKHHLTHIPFQPWCTSCVKGKAQAEPHKRTERIIEDSELPVIQCDFLMLEDVAGTGGLKMLSMYVITFIILQCDLEPSLIKWAESVKSKRPERTVI